MDELKSIVLDSDCKVKNIKSKRKKQTLKFKKEVITYLEENFWLVAN